MMKKVFHSLPFALLIVALAGGVGAYKVIARRDRAEKKATDERIRAEVQSSMDSMKIELPPLSEAGNSHTSKSTP